MNEAIDRHALFKSLHQQYFAMVKQICLGYMKGDGYAAQDITQEVFINVWNALDRFRSEATYKTWIYRITVNTCLLYLRGLNKARAIYELTEVHDESTLSAETNEENDYKALYKAIGELPHLDRLIMMLLLEELSYEEISAITGVSGVHLRVKIHRIKKKMRQSIQTE